MAPGTDAPSRFRGRGRGADCWTTLVKTPGSAAAGADGPIFAAGVLRPPAFLFWRAHADGQRVHAERLAAIRALGRNVCGDAGDREDFRENRSQARTPAKDSSRSWNTNHLAATTQSCFRFRRSTAFHQKRNTRSGSTSTKDGHSPFVDSAVFTVALLPTRFITPALQPLPDSHAAKIW